MIAAPTLLVWGKHDPVIPLRIGRRIERRIPDSQLVVIDSGHVPHTTEPRRVAKALERFVRALEETATERTTAR